jgi:hypothetical protein
MTTPDSKKEMTRRTFLGGVAATVPTIQFLGSGAAELGNAETGSLSGSGKATHSGKFTPIVLTQFFNCSPADFGPRTPAKHLDGYADRDELIRTPAGLKSLRGIPFLLGSGEWDQKGWALLSVQSKPWATRILEIPIKDTASFVCVASFCDWEESVGREFDEDAKIGQVLAQARLVYSDGSELALSVRRRFEVNPPSIPWGHLCYAALPHLQDSPRKLTDPLDDGTEWGHQQYGLRDGRFPVPPKNGRNPAFLWIWAAENPEPLRPLKALRLEAASDDPLVICGLTLYHGRENPLRVEPLSVYRITLPEASVDAESRWKLEVDLGAVTRTFALGKFNPDSWLAEPGISVIGEWDNPVRTLHEGGIPIISLPNGKALFPQGPQHLYVELTANPDATLLLRDTKTGAIYEFDLAQLVTGKELEGKPAAARIEIIERERTWVRGKVVDSATGRPTPVRLAFRSKEGRYIPPYGHRREINYGWFQDYGADLKLLDTSFAYIDGTFLVELPVGDVYVEMTKGFEYEAVRKKLTIDLAQRELNLEISRFTDNRSKGWVTADTHVHFLSPSTAMLEGQAEGLNLINLLAAQWGDLFTNVGDLPYGPLTSNDGETLVQIGTENRQHILGHMSLLGARGEPVYPMSVAGPQESYLGDALWNSLADWADSCHERGGLVVTPHFPYPAAEVAADIVLGKTDAVEFLRDRGEDFTSPRVVYWYRVLNCGYRLPLVGGTDKMEASTPVGCNRTYAYLGQQEFTFENWAKAVRSGNTFMTSGPLLFFHADGRMPGEEITLGPGGGSVEVQAEATCFIPLHRLEIVRNGHVVASHEEGDGARTMTLRDKLQVDGPGWLAARCISNTGLLTSSGFRLLAHTSPVYTRSPGQDLLTEPGETFLMTLIEGAQTWMETLATRPDLERLNRIRKMLAEAKSRLHQRMHQHGIPH